MPRPISPPLSAAGHRLDERPRQHEHVDARNWYTRWYVPNNAFRGGGGRRQVGGGVRPGAKYYGRIKPGPAPTQAQLEPEQRGVRRAWWLKAPGGTALSADGWKCPVLRDVTGTGSRMR